MERFGRLLRTQVNRSPQEQQELQQHLADAHRELPDTIRRKAEELERLISRLDPLDVIANAALANSVFDANTYKEYEFEGNPAYAEYLTLICLKRPRWQSDHRLVSAAEHGPVDALVKDIFEHTHFYYATEIADPDRQEPPTILEEMRFLARSEQLAVRFPAYEHHLRDQLSQLFHPFDDWMRENLDFTIAEAISISQGIGQFTTRQLSERGRAAQDDMRLLRRQVRDARRGRLQESKLPEDLIERLASMSEKDMVRETKNMSRAFMFWALGDTLTFRSSDLADLTNVPTEHVSSFLDLFSIQFGEVSADFYSPSPTHELQARPIVRFDGAYVCPSPAGLLWALRPTIEAAINPGSTRPLNTVQRVWERYSLSRGQYLEREALRLLGSALEHAETYHQLKYTFPESPDDEFELDGLVRFDRALILLEGKAGVMKASARRGAPASMIESVEDLVADAHKQALRARSYIEAADVPEFRTGDGQRVTLDKESFDEVIMVTVTLDPLSVFPAIMHKIAKLDLFGPGDLPWTVPITDLRVICEFIEFPSQLIHYIGRRLRLREVDFVRAHDELDYFGHYLTEGLYFEDIKKDMGPDVLRVFQLLSHTGPFDEYYLKQSGARSRPTPRPRQEMPSELRELILSLEHEHPHGYVPIVCALLDSDAKTRRMMGRQLAKRAAAVKKDGRFHDYTLFFDDEKRALAFMCGPRSKAVELHSKLTDYCMLKKYQTRYDSWVGIGCFAEDPYKVVMYVRNDDPWRYDEEFEKLAKEVLPADPKYIEMKR